MIILTTPLQVPTVLGSATTVGYNKLRVVSITLDPVSLTINAQVQLMVSTIITQPMIYGSLSIIATGATPVCVLQVPNLNFNATVTLAGANLTTVQGWITGMQNSIEQGLISIAEVAGTQSTGT
jgi:hypothetical protein